MNESTPDDVGEAGSSAELVGRIEDGDPAAEAALIEVYRRGIGYLARRLAGSVEEAEDLTQETFRVVLEALRRGDLQEPERLASYVRGVAHNLARGGWRKRERRGVHESLGERYLPDPQRSPLAAVISEQDRQRVHQVLHAMSSVRDRQVLVRHYLAEDDRQQICSELEISQDGYYLVLHRARQRFKKLLLRTRASGLKLVESKPDEVPVKGLET